MKTTLLLFTLALIGLNCCAQQQINKELKKELDTILFRDQGIREFFDTEVTEKRKDTLAQLLHYPKAAINWKLMEKIDSANLVKVEQIISKYGYPGKSMVGEPANTAVFYVIQHAPSKIPTYYKLIKRAGKAGELPLKYLAMMTDRMLMNEKKEQLYGTQVFMYMINNPKTGKKEPFEYVVPIKDAKNVNKRRKAAGFDTTVEENALRFGITYKAYTLEEIEKAIKQ